MAAKKDTKNTDAKKTKKDTKTKAEKVKRTVLSKNDIIDAVSDNLDLSRSDVDSIVSEAFDVITNSLTEDKDVQIYGFGKFFVKDVPARKARNPKTGETIDVDATKKPGFKASSTLKERIKEM